MGLLTRILRTGGRAQLKALSSLTPDIGAWERELEQLDDDALRAKTDEFRRRVDRGEQLDDLLIEAFAVTREAARRVLGQRHYDVQLMGGAALHFGWVAEMATGEGKTLVSTLPAYLNGLTGKGVHIVTVNDYLARRDSETVGEVHRWLGLTVGRVGADIGADPTTRRDAYLCDITYGTNNEFGFDYLRDNMVARADDRVQRGHHYAIVDEIDSILIDEARTPLIISGPAPGSSERYLQFADIVATLQEGSDFELDDEKLNVVPLPEGIAKVEAALGIDNLYEGSPEMAHQLTVALKARALYERDRDYLVEGDEVVIVDEFTGRVLDGRRWGNGVHQAVEAKEGVTVQPETQTFATVTLQNYFKMYHRLAGMTGTATTDAAELHAVYGLSVVNIPTHRPVQRIDHRDLVFSRESSKNAAIIKDVAARVAAGQPVLVGTSSVLKSEQLSKQLDEAGIAHEVLNAKQHSREAEVIAQAGRPGAVTVATNMAGRGVDILLGGNPDALAAAALARDGFEPGSDESQQRHRELLEQYRQQCAVDADAVRRAGGLYVLGTERHESRRIDLQLRGRAGRQGDPGESRFYLSLEDDMLANFSTGSVSKLMGASWDDAPIEAKMVDKAVERAQSAVEGRHAQARKAVVDYDEVHDTQRNVIYRHRNAILDGADLRSEVHDAIGAEMSAAAHQHLGTSWDIDRLIDYVDTIIKTADRDAIAAALDTATDTTDAAASLTQFAIAHYDAAATELGAEAAADLERIAMLRTLDREWLEHLRDLDHLEDGISLRAAGQKNPLDEWRREAYDLFEVLLERIKSAFARTMLSIELTPKQDTANNNPESSGEANSVA